jgi:murein DD-endopeptidase MepM/ murein hydrolase activator NlpD
VIQNYVDRDPGPGWRDYTCGRLSYDGHRGTDFRLPSLRRMEEGVEVLAAAPGLVVGVRDGEPDLSLRDQAPGASDAKMAGNGVRISHDDGWTSQYSHLRRGSLRVKPGQHVVAGEVLGLVGLSGHTEFPHLDFSVSQRGRVVDPFAVDAAARCGEPAGSLWSPAAQAQLGYRASGVLVAGFASRVLSRSELQRGDRFAPNLPADAPAIVFQLELFGARADDVEELTLIDPAGRELATHHAVLPGDLALRRLQLGRRRIASTWPVGDYQAHYVLRRGDQIVAESRATLPVR